MKKDTFINRILNYNSFYKNVIFTELEKLWLICEKKRGNLRKEYQEKERKYREEKEKLFKVKYPKEKKWKDAIFKVKEDIINDRLNLIKLYISESSNIYTITTKPYYNRF